VSGLATVGGRFVREHLRTPLTLTLLVAIPVFFVLIFASVLDEFAEALGGELPTEAATSISAGWAAAFLCGTLAFFEVASSRRADRRLALAGLGAGRVAVARILAAIVLGVLVSAIAYLTLFLRSGIEHPWHAAAAVLAFALIYTGIGALIGAFVSDPLNGSLLVVVVFAVDVFSGPQMTPNSLFNWTPTRDAATVLIAAGSGETSPPGDWIKVGLAVLVALSVATAAFWLAARARD
jgi:hypothetical protein